jgi:hypothetical protein
MPAKQMLRLSAAEKWLAMIITGLVRTAGPTEKASSSCDLEKSSMTDQRPVSLYRRPK